MRAGLALGVLLSASSALADGERGALTGGIGMGHAFLGGQLEVGVNNWSAFGAIGPETFALGTRWSMRPDGSGLGVALHATVWHGSGCCGDHGTTTVLAATAHWRWKWGFFILDAGAGPAFSLSSYRQSSTDLDVPEYDRGKLTQSACFGVLLDNSCSGGATVFPIDVELGLGFAF
jgi:hypothetical protein